MEIAEEKPPKIEILQLIQNHFASIGICPYLVLQSYPFNMRIFLGLLTCSLYIICSMIYLISTVNSITENTQTIFMSSGAALIILILLTLVFHADELFKYINDCEDIVNTTLKYSASRSIFIETNRLEPKLCEAIFFIMPQMTPVTAVFPWIIYIFLIYFTTDLGNAAFELLLPMWFPLDCKIPFGFLVIMLVEYMIISYLLFVGACVFALAFASYSYVIAMNKCIKEILFVIGEGTRDKIEPNQMLEQLTEFVEFHSRVKQLIRNLSHIYQRFVTLSFVWTLIEICSAMLMIQLQISHQNANWAVLFLTPMQTVYAFCVIIVICELSQRTNQSFDKCYEIIVQFQWYLFPIQVQRLLPMIINSVQQPVEINLYGSWSCGRNTLKYVIKTAFSYFMVLRKFYN